MKVYGAALDDGSVDVRTVSFEKDDCIILGNEGNGISKRVLDLCDKKIIIPMQQNAESLNAAAAAAVLIYVLLGMAGLPVFAGFAGGAGTVLGPTGGYILGYLPLAWLSGWAVERFPARRWVQMAAFAAATAILYLLGTAWYCLQSGTAPAAAAALCVLPFLPGDLAKIAAAGVVGPLLRRRLEQAELI